MKSTHNNQVYFLKFNDVDYPNHIFIIYFEGAVTNKCYFGHWHIFRNTILIKETFGFYELFFCLSILFHFSL
jgi:hypothetical protein